MQNLTGVYLTRLLANIYIYIYIYLFKGTKEVICSDLQFKKGW